MVVGLVGLAMMAIPAFGGHGNAGALHGHAGLGHVAGAHHAAPHPTHAQDETVVVADPAPEQKLRFIPSPRAIFTLLALYGAFGNALLRAGHCSKPLAAVLALVPALLVERYLIRPLFSLVFRLQARPSTALDALVQTLMAAQVITGGGGKAK